MLRVFVLFILVLTSSACTHLHADLTPQGYTQQKIIQTETSMPKIQVLVTRGPFYFTHSAIRVQSNNKVYFWDPSGAYGLDEYAEYFKENPLPKNFYKKEDLISVGAPTIDDYWLYAKYTSDLGMEVFEWKLTNTEAEHYQNIFLAGSLGGNQYDFDSHDTFLLCSSALSRYLNHFVSEHIPLNETFFFPDSLAHKLYSLKPDRIIIFTKDEETKIFQ